MPGIHKKGHYLRECKRSPRAFIKGSFRTLKRGKHRIVTGHLKSSGRQATQTILHPLSERAKLMKRRLQK